MERFLEQLVYSNQRYFESEKSLSNFNVLKDKTQKLLRKPDNKRLICMEIHRLVLIYPVSKTQRDDLYMYFFETNNPFNVPPPYTCIFHPQREMFLCKLVDELSTAVCLEHKLSGLSLKKTHSFIDRIDDLTSMEHITWKTMDEIDICCHEAINILCRTSDDNCSIIELIEQLFFEHMQNKVSNLMYLTWLVSKYNKYHTEKYTSLECLLTKYDNEHEILANFFDD
jgi:hypothetical protein